MDKTSAVYPHPNSENIFYAVKDKIWLLNTATNTRILFHDFKDPDVNVVEMHIKDAYAYMMFIALNKGDKGYVYRFGSVLMECLKIQRRDCSHYRRRMI